MMNKILFISFLFSFFLHSPASLTQPQWLEQNSSTNRELTDVCFVDQNNGWISGWTGTMLHTTDGGDTWNTQNILPNNAYYSVFFTDLLNGWASGYAGKIVHTSDGGQTWVDQTAPVNTDYYKVYFVNSDIGWIAGGDAGTFPNFIEHRVILYTSNGGVNWSAQYSESNKSRLNSIIFVDQNNGYATGESGIIMKTTDGGSNWTEQVIPSFHFRNIFFIDNLTGWVTGYYLGVPHYTAVFNTTDGGINWNETSFGTDESISGIYFTDNMKGWAVGGSNSEGIIYYTSDGGSNWELQNIPLVNSLYRVYFFNEYCGWAVGHLGTIIATDNAVPVTPELSTPVEYSLKQNYPNPFNPATTIKYSIPSDGIVKLSVFNAIGEVVSTLVNEFKSAGNYEIDIDAGGLSSGIYFYRMQAGNFVETKKMVLMK
jgi:photosystem II stability/assembly factor-like uncharacterized protein